ncbi:hypothetical protein [Symbiobacterium thermophilum]|jgi:hypothetical protein|uniref:Adhesin domain-containing protein n=1 Tax=Symbiobacterium thermophilum TaxID=2734 RepID=A0A1Y2T9G4_SYMTR|nr:hypothetical protein [Symbiobacterium thermophilum]MBY6274939.1 hypothetical protein [Symbiobacterium thermophilum]OTA41825.1 MAG: hypothetical protein A6D92_03555 [Symbiobacterium thermophilum]
MDATPRRVGRATVAIGFVATGAALLADNVAGAGPRFTDLLLRLWPVFLIGFGLEFLVSGLLSQAGQPRPVRIEVGGAALLAGALALASVIRATSGFGWHSAPIPEVTSHTVTRSVPAAGAEALLVDVDVGRVSLLTYDEEEVRVEVEYGVLGLVPPNRTAAAAREYRLEVEGGRTIRVTGRGPDENPESGLSLGTLTAHYRIYAPAGLNVRVESGVGAISVEGYDGSLDLRTRAGGITVEGGSGTLYAESGSGRVHVDSFSGPVTASTNAGPVTARAVEGDLTIRTGTGVINVEEHRGPSLTAETRTGSVHARMEHPPAGPVVLRTRAGTISLTVPAESDVTVTATTRSGTITGLGAAGGTGPARATTQILGAGTYPVRLEANAGSIHFDTF